ncbi:unnamed protein product [Echinostoma caproni]|uniref:NTR domain-containing protein n=1 Tax=Echinostoma caproni TaxID=27848 RepID=A0A183A5Z2_9TREM|nr:unnamed protein product [Echinostoma caproni]
MIQFSEAEHYAYRRKTDEGTVFRGTVESQKSEGDKIRYEVRIQDTWRVDGAASRLLPKKASASLPAYPVWAKIREHIVTNKDGRQMRCFCPDMNLGRSYLFLTQSYQVPNGNRMELMLDEQSVVLPWREAWRRRLTKFLRRAARGKCDTLEDDKDGGTTRLRRVQRLRNAPGYFSAHIDQQVHPRMPSNGQNVYRRDYGMPVVVPHVPPSSPKPPPPPPSPPAASSAPALTRVAQSTGSNGRMRSSAIQNDHGFVSRPGTLQTRTQGDQPAFTYYHPYMGYYNAKH